MDRIWWSASSATGPSASTSSASALGSISQRMLTLTLRSARARRAGHAHRVPDHPAAGRLRADRTRPLAARAGQRNRLWARQNRPPSRTLATASTQRAKRSRAHPKGRLLCQKFNPRRRSQLFSFSCGFVDGAQTLPKTRNVVFVHGLFADGSCWSKVIARSGQGSSQTDMPGSKPVGSPCRSRRRRNVLRS